MNDLDLDFEYDFCPMCDHGNALDAIRCRACGMTLVTLSEGMRRLFQTAEQEHVA